MTRGRLAALGLAVLLIAGAGYHYLGDRALVLSFSEAELQERVAALPPVTRTYLGVVQVTIDAPRISLTEASDRVRAGAEVAVEAGLRGRPLALRGSVDASGGVRYDPATGGFHITDLAVERLDLPGLPDEHAPRVRDAVSRALGAYYARHPIYTLRPTDTRRAAARYLLKDVTVRDRRLLLTLGV